jgi:glycosyltransferase involved in cell wall biosynthesis
LNWVHYVHAAYTPSVEGSLVRKLKWRWSHDHSLRHEKSALLRARVVFANSRMTKERLVGQVGVPEKRVQIVYYGIDRDRFRPASEQERIAARAALGFNERPTIAFIGGLGDRRKGFDTLFEAWRELCSFEDWDADLVVVGVGSELECWKAKATRCGLASRITFLGFRSDVDRLLTASDALVAPTRYEAYGLGVHEAICCGIPAFVSASAGVAERYSPALRGLLIRDPNDAAELAGLIRAWRSRKDVILGDVRAFSDRLRERTWNDMAADIVAAGEEHS